MDDSKVMPIEVTVAPAAEESDGQILELWLHGRGANTTAAYRLEVRRFLSFTGKPLARTTLVDVQAFADSLGHLAPATRARALAAIKSLMAFGHRLGYLPFDVARPLRLPAQRNRLAERILSEDDIHRMLDLEPNERNSVLLRLLYAAGVRVGELTGLCWRDVVERPEGGQITVFGKGGKTRAILLPKTVWSQLIHLRNGAGADGVVFRSRVRGGALTRVQVERIVLAAARRAGIPDRVSPHWLRHAHASHALDHGAPIHLVQATLGHTSVATTGRYLHARPTESSGQFLVI